MAKRKPDRSVQKSPYRPNSKKRQGRSDVRLKSDHKDVIKPERQPSKVASWMLVISLLIGIGGPAVVSIINMYGTMPSTNPPAMFAPWWVALIGLGVIVLGIVNFRLLQTPRKSS